VNVQGIPSNWISTTSSRYVWTACDCGKERQLQIPKWISDELTPMYVKVFSRFMCKRCQAEYYKNSNTCPEMIQEGRVPIPCALKYDHEGRCQRWP
jgi:hypothetical protein